MTLSTRTGRAANSRLRYEYPDLGDALGWKTLFVVPFGCSGVLGYIGVVLSGRLDVVKSCIFDICGCRQVNSSGCGLIITYSYLWVGRLKLKAMSLSSWWALS